MEKTSTSVWNSCLQIIKDNIPAQSYKTWFEPVKAVRLEGNVLTIQLPIACARWVFPSPTPP